MTPYPDPVKLRAQLEQAAPVLWAEVSTLANGWTAPIFDGLKRRGESPSYPKSFNDPVWGTIELLPWETILLDSPLLQRLRGIRQLGTAHYVYPGASHSRLEHSLGVVEASERIIQSLKRNAAYRRQFDRDPDVSIPDPSRMDVLSIRLAALLHDIGHGSFSHVTEPLLRDQFPEPFDRVKELLQSTFGGAQDIATSEIVAVLLVMTDAMGRVFTHEHFSAPLTNRAELPVAIAAHIIGSRSCLNATYLSGVISGPLDADKLDYMARDCYHAGLPLAIHASRLINKLEVVTITPDNTSIPTLRKRVEATEAKRIYEIGISLSGLSAYEQMIVGRVMLYDRLYYHHKVRSAESMIRRLIKVAGSERGRQLKLSDFFQRAPDDAMILLWNWGHLSNDPSSQHDRAYKLGDALLTRTLHHRAFAFAARFIELNGGAEDDKVLLWNTVLIKAQTLRGCD